MPKFTKMRISLTAKLLLLFLSVFFISIVVFGEIAYKEASAGMTEAVYNQIEGINARHFQMLHALAEITDL